MTDLQTAAREMKAQLVAWRRDLHMYPELGYEEERTAGIVAAHLERLGYRVQRGVAKTGVIGLLEGASPGPVVMLRFDMDALPVDEETGAEYASRVPGKMHACGHDAHVAIGMGVAQLLAARRAEMAGALKLIFQPAEEGGRGGELMVEEGALENPRPDVFIACHVWVEKPVGVIDVTPGPVMAGAEKWRCLIRGKGGHGAMPHHAVDPIVAAAHVVTALQTVVSRNISPLDTAVVSVGSIHGGDAFNVIPPQVEMSGSIRTFALAARQTVLERVPEIIRGVAAACGAEAEVEITPLTPAVINDAAVVEVVQRAVCAVLGEEGLSVGERTMGSEDAAFFMREIPGCYFFVGAANAERGITAYHHNPHFDIDEDALPLAVAVLAHAAVSYLGVGA